MKKLLVFCVFSLLIPLSFALAETTPSTQPIKTFVSVLPQKYLVERVGGEHVEVSAMVGPGRSPHTYEPTPRQMSELSRTRVFFQIGVPFEQVWIKRITALNPALELVDLRKGIRLLPSPAHHHDHHHGHGEELDPHIWTDPMLAKIMAGQILETLSRLQPQRKADFTANYQALVADLAELDRYIRDRLDGVKQRRFLVFHPSWGYFAAAYDLEQIAIETEGKEPGPRALARIIDLARKNNIRTIFIQPQFSRTTAETVARAIDGKVEAIDPLSEDYLDNLRKAADAFVLSLE
ncbi:MAG: zinc ABC transporter substrate-binding protein [Syntrophotaleaceae bacterium]